MTSDQRKLFREACRSIGQEPRRDGDGLSCDIPGGTHSSEMTYDPDDEVVHFVGTDTGGYTSAQMHGRIKEVKGVSGDRIKVEFESGAEVV